MVDETPFRLSLRSLLAGFLAEVGAVALLFLLWRALYGSWAPGGLWVYAGGVGLTLGAAFGLAELSARKLLLLGLMLGAALSPLVIAAGEFFVGLVAGKGGLLEAYGSLGSVFELDGPRVLLVMWGALALYGPLLFVRRRGVETLGQVYAMGFGLVLWAAPLPFLPVTFEVLNLGIYLTPLMARVVLFPLALRAGDHAVDAILRRLRQGDDAPAARAVGQLRSSSPRERRQARYETKQGEQRTGEGKHLEAGEAFAKAAELWPSGDRSLRAARAFALGGEPYRAIDQLRAALDDPSCAVGFDDPDLASLHGLEPFEVLRRESAQRAPRPPARAPIQLGWATHVFMACLAAVLLAAARQPLAHPKVPAQVTLDALRLEFRGEGTALYELALGLQLGGSPGRKALLARSVGLPRALLRLGIPPLTQQDEQLAVRLYLRAARAGHTESMLRSGLVLVRRGKVKGAAYWFRKAAAAGDTEAMVRLAVLLRGGSLGVGKDEEALGWYRKAATAGEVDAMIALGEWLELRREHAEAFRWFGRAAAKGSPYAQVQHQRMRRLHPDLR